MAAKTIAVYWAISNNPCRPWIRRIFTITNAPFCAADNPAMMTVVRIDMPWRSLWTGAFWLTEVLEELIQSLGHFFILLRARPFGQIQKPLTPHDLSLNLADFVVSIFPVFPQSPQMGTDPTPSRTASTTNSSHKSCLLTQAYHFKSRRPVISRRSHTFESSPRTGCTLPVELSYVPSVAGDPIAVSRSLLRVTLLLPPVPQSGVEPLSLDFQTSACTTQAVEAYRGPNEDRTRLV